MNWVNALCDLYEKNESLVGKFITRSNDEQKPLILLPLSHMTVLAQIEVTLDERGDFMRARKLSKEEALTLIPVSEGSAIRTSGAVAHPLMDSLPYIAGDYDRFRRIELDKKNNPIFYRERYNEYINKLSDWCTSDYAHPKANCIYLYLKKACLMEDLIKQTVLQIDTEGFLLNDVKIQNVVQEKAFVRFRIETGEAPDLLDETGRFLPEIWMDLTLQKSYIDYFMHQPSSAGLCYLSGRVGRTTNSFPKKIRHDGDGTKMFSSNDNDGYTYRGRFDSSDEAFSIGYESSHKVHSALNWIIRKQGYIRNGLYVVSWESDLKPYASVCDDAADIIIQAQSDDIYDIDEDEIAPSSTRQDTNYLTAMDFNMALDGYLKNVSNTSNMVVMALDAATKGRLSITYFNRLPYSHYLNNIAFWHQSCCWRHAKFINKQLNFYEGMASIYDIALALYGIEQETFLKLKTDSDGKAPMMVSTFQRLVPCMLERKRIPTDMARVAVVRASAPLAYDRNNWLKILSIACSIVKKTKFDMEGEVWNMALDHGCTDRSYLYGRLLAVADRAEEATYDIEEEKRETNAMRYMDAFSRRPYRTWQIIEERLRPYLNKLPKKSRIFFKKLLNEIQNLFTIDKFADDNALEGLYLLGFHSQLNVFYTKKEASDIKEQKNDKDGEAGEASADGKFDEIGEEEKYSEEDEGEE